MTRKKKIKAKIGDVFRFPIKVNTYCFGQIIAESRAVVAKLYILFDFVTDQTPDLKSIIDKPILAIAHLDSGSIEDGEWTIIGNTDVALKNIKYPIFLTGPEPYVINYDDKVLRLATEQDLQSLDYPKSYTSNIFEGLAKAKFCDEEWEEVYDKILFDKKKWVNSSVAGDQEVHEVFLADQEETNEIENEMISISIRYKLDSKKFGTPEDLEKRYKIEDLVSAALRRTENGNCDGGEIGNGEMIVFCHVFDLDKAVKTIEQELQKHELLGKIQFKSI